MGTKVLLIEDDESFANSIELMLRPHNITVTVAPTVADGIKAYKLNVHGFATVIVDYCLPDLNGTEAVSQIKRINPVQDILFTSGYQQTDFLMDMLQTEGARTFIPKGKSSDEIKSVILDSIHIFESKNRVVGFDDYCPTKIELELKRFGLVGRSPRLLPVIEKIPHYQTSQYPILVLGGTGSGKELIAKALTPPGKELICVNCARYRDNEQLLESELFGYVKGAFTGAEKDTPGLISRAHGQVLFLDELHELPRSAQAKLLRFLETMRYRRVGDNSRAESSVSFKLIAAGKPIIREMIEQGLFVEDLLHRVGQLQINMPSLNERPEDFEPLIRMIQDEFNRERKDPYKKQVRISTIEAMKSYNWTGNVRQLQNAVKQMLTDCPTDIVNIIDFERYLENVGAKKEAIRETQISLEEATRKFEEDQIKKYLSISKSQNEAAKSLGIDPSTLSKKLVRFGIKAEVYLAKSLNKEENHLLA